MLDQVSALYVMLYTIYVLSKCSWLKIRTERSHMLDEIRIVTEKNRQAEADERLRKKNEQQMASTQTVVNDDGLWDIQVCISPSIDISALCNWPLHLFLG